MYYTNVIKNDELFMLAENTDKFKKRDCFLLLQHFFSESYDGKVLIIYGLPNTGKTTLMLQKINELPKDKVVYIKITEADNMKMLCKDLDKLKTKGYKYIFIDEITLMKDFISQAALLSDIYASMRMKIVISGNDSLSFVMAKRDELYDRCFMIHTTNILYSEYSRLFNDSSIDNYIEHGGKLEKANTFYENSLFYDPKTMMEYIDKAVSSNVLNTYEKCSDNDYFRYFKVAFEKGDLRNIFNQYMKKFLYYIVIDSMKGYYDFNNATFEEKEIIKKSIENFELVSAKEDSIINFDHQDMILRTLQSLDLLDYYREYYEKYSDGEIYIFKYPVMINVMAKEYIHDILLDKYFDTASIEEEKRITDKIYSALKMSVYVDTIYLEMIKNTKCNIKVFRFNYHELLERYFVVYDYDTNTYRFYEVRYDKEIVNKKTSALFSKEKVSYINKIYGKMSCRYVIYLGDSKTVDGIGYLNVEEFINNQNIGYEFGLPEYLQNDLDELKKV